MTHMTWDEQTGALAGDHDSRRGPRRDHGALERRGQGDASRPRSCSSGIRPTAGSRCASSSRWRCPEGQVPQRQRHRRLPRGHPRRRARGAQRVVGAARAAARALHGAALELDFRRSGWICPRRAPTETRIEMTLRSRLPPPPRRWAPPRALFARRAAGRRPRSPPRAAPRARCRSCTPASSPSRPTRPPTRPTSRTTSRPTARASRAPSPTPSPSSSASRASQVKWTVEPFDSSYAPGPEVVRLRHQRDLDHRARARRPSTSRRPTTPTRRRSSSSRAPSTRTRRRSRRCAARSSACRSARRASAR